MMRQYVFMRTDELDDEMRAEGSKFLEGIYEFPNFNEDDEPMWLAFLTWESALNKKGQAEWETIYGPESRVYLEETYESQFHRSYHFHGL